MTIFSGQSVISRVYTSRFGNGTGSHGTSTEVVLKKYQVPGTVPSGKPPKSEPYRTVPCRTMQWKSAITVLAFFLTAPPYKKHLTSFRIWPCCSCLQTILMRLCQQRTHWTKKSLSTSLLTWKKHFHHM